MRCYNIVIHNKSLRALLVLAIYDACKINIALAKFIHTFNSIIYLYF